MRNQNHFVYMNFTRVKIGSRDYNEYELECPECGARLRLKRSRWGIFYGCEDYWFRGCSFSVSAKDTGEPTTIPEDRKTVLARRRAQEAFDSLWQSGVMDRREAFSWMCGALGVERKNALISQFDSNTCNKLIMLIANK